MNLPPRSVAHSFLSALLLFQVSLAGTVHAATYWVSPSGSDTANDGLSATAPFASIQHAANLMVAGDTCNIRAGTYRETVTVPNSGNAAHPITFQAYNATPATPATAEIVTISGADPITNWTLESPNIYRANNMPAGWSSLNDGNQVFQNSVIKPEARWPNAGSTFPWQDSTINPSPDWAYVDTADYDAGGGNGWFADAQLPVRANGYWVGAKVHIMMGYGWYIFNPTVTSYTDSTKTLVTDENHGPVAGGSAGAYTMIPGNEYYLTGIKGEMDSDGEWFYDTSTGRLCFWSTTPPVNVEVKSRPYGFKISGKSFINLTNLRFFACTLDPVAPLATDCVFDRIDMKYLSHSRLKEGEIGLSLGSRCVLRNSELAFSSSGLLYLKGSDIRVINNRLHDGAYVPAGVGAVTAIGYGADPTAANRNLISHNTIHSLGHAAIGYPGRAAIVQYNDIYDGMKMSTDGALFYWASDGGNGIVRYNLIHDAMGPVGHVGAGVMGLYFDNQNSGWVAHHNIIWNISGRSIHNNARNNFDMVFNNTCWNCDGGAIQSHFWSDGETGCKYFNNLFGGVPGGNQKTWNLTDERYNLYADSFSVPPASVPPGIPNFRNLKPVAIDAGTEVPGVTDGFAGSAPDIGALESGVPDWTGTAGYHQTPPSPDPTYVMPAMPFANQIRDGSFESGSLSPHWATSSGSNVGLLYSSAWYDSHLRSSYFGLQFGGGTSEVSQVVTGLQSGRRYKFYCGVQKTDPSAVVTVGVRSYGSPDVEFTVPTTGIWQQNEASPVPGMVAVPFVTGSASTSATVYVRVTRAANSPVAPKNPDGSFPTVAATSTYLGNYNNSTLISPWYPATGVYVDDLGVEMAQENTDPLSYRMPVVSLPFNETGGLTAYDTTTHGKNAALTGATFAPGRQGNALTFTGINHYASANSVVLPAAGGSFTVAFWLKINSVGVGESPRPVNNAGWMQKGWHIMSTSALRVGMYLWTTANSLTTDSPATGMSAWLSQPLALGVWTHVAYTFDRASGLVRCYRDGVADSYATIPEGFGEIATTTGLQLGTGFSNGQMDDFQLWDYALNAREIAGVFAPDPALALRFKFDEGSGATTAWDASGNRQHAALANSTFTPSKQGLGNALTFSGTAGSATTPGSPQVPLAGGSGSFSVAFWAKLTGVGADPRIASTNTGGLPAKGWVVGSDGSLNLRLRLFDQNLAEVSSALSSGLAPSTWTHVVYTIDRPNARVTRYLNGVPDGTDAIPAGFGAVDTTDALRLATNITSGKVDDFRLYQKVLTWQEVQDIPRQLETSPYGSGAGDLPVTELDAVQTSSLNAQITWADNASNETGFRIERKTGTGGTYGMIGTVGPNTTTFADPGPFTQGMSYFYRVVATGAAGDLGTSNETSFAALPGSIAFLDTTQMKVSRAAGIAQIPVRRSGGVTGAVTVSYATSNSSAVAGTHFTAASGTLSWADGEMGIKNIPVPVANGATPQQARQFRLTLSAPGGGAGLGAYNSLAVLIEDPALTLPAPWIQTVIDGNSSVIDFSPAGVGEGVLGSATTGGSGLTVSATQESGRFIYQTQTGDGTLTAFVQTPVPAQTGARLAVMVREPGDGFSRMASTVTSGDTTFGSKFVYRTSSAGNSTLDGLALSQTAPSWIRITRLGNLFTSEISTNGTAWTKLGSATVAISPTARWGLFHTSNGPVVSPALSADYQLATFQSVAFASLPVPATPTGFICTGTSATGISLQWNTKANSAGYRIERRTEDGIFTQVADLTAVSSTTQWFTDSATGDTSYQYRVIAYNSSGASSPSTSIVAVTPPPDLHVTRTTDDTGGADAAVRKQTPGGTFGTQDVLTVSGPDPITSAPLAFAKAYLRFDLSALPGPIKTATLKLAFIAQRSSALTGWFYMNPYLLTTDTADVWDETTLTWNNAPLNDVAGTSDSGLLAPSINLGFYYITKIADFPAVGAQASIALYPATINANIGANNLVTIVALQRYTAAQVDWASREHASYPAPALELTFDNPMPKRPGFLTVTPGTGSTMALAWIDSSTNETGFQIERRVANGAWTSLATTAANATGYTDATGLPGVAYDYRVRSVSATGVSSWASTTRLQTRTAATVNGPIRSPDGVTFSSTGTLGGNGYVPTGFTYSLPAQNFVTGQNLSASLFNNVTGWVGMRISVQGQPITLRDLARWVVPGNSGTHTLKLVNVTTGADVPGGSVSVNTAGTPAGFQYVALAAPVTLAANSSYYLLSQETSGGDQWYQGATALDSATSVATSLNSAISTDGINFTSSSTYIPVSFTYTLTPDPVPFVGGHGMTTLRNDYTGWLGMRITTGGTAMVVGELGRWVVPGNSGTHNLKIVNAGTGAHLGSVSIATAGSPTGQFRYAPLAPVVTLAPNTSYLLLSQETAGGDRWYDFDTSTAGTATGYQSWLLANGLPMDASGTGSATATPASDGLPNLIKYALGLAPTTGGNGGHLTFGEVIDTGNDYLTLTYTRPEPVPAGIAYTVESSSDLASWTTTGLVEIGSTVNTGLRTITVRNAIPMTGSNKSFLRLKVTQP